MAEDPDAGARAADRGRAPERRPGVRAGALRGVANDGEEPADRARRRARSRARRRASRSRPSSGFLRVYETPGHAPSHVVLHEPESGMLISGDHLLGRVSLFFDHGHTPDPVGEFLDLARRRRRARRPPLPRRPRPAVPRRRREDRGQPRAGRRAARPGAGRRSARGRRRRSTSSRDLIGPENLNAGDRGLGPAARARLPRPPRGSRGGRAGRGDRPGRVAARRAEFGRRGPIGQRPGQFCPARSPLQACRWDSVMTVP